MKFCNRSVIAPVAYILQYCIAALRMQIPHVKNWKASRGKITTSIWKIMKKNSHDTYPRHLVCTRYAALRPREMHLPRCSSRHWRALATARQQHRPAAAALLPLAAAHARAARPPSGPCALSSFFPRPSPSFPAASAAAASPRRRDAGHRANLSLARSLALSPPFGAGLSARVYTRRMGREERKRERGEYVS